jgi:uncharacterized protein (TIGR03067 family)
MEMTRMTAHLRRMGLILVGLVAVGGGLRAEDTVEGDLAKLKGAWTNTSPEGVVTTYTFNGKTLDLKGPSRTYKMTLILDPKAKPDKTINFQIDEGPDDAKGKTSKGIYKFDGEDRFIFCMRPEGDRPTKYEQVGFEQFVMELKRKK